MLPAAAVYGANGAGKTNLLRAMDDMRAQVLQSFRYGSPIGGVERHPFRLDPDSRERPSTFEIEVVLEGVRHEYGFTVDDSRYLSEWAYRYPKGRRQVVFERTADGVEFSTGQRARGRRVE